MPVVDVKKGWSEDRAEITQGTGRFAVDISTIGQYSVLMDSLADTELDAVNAAGLPGIGDTITGYPYVTCRRRGVVRRAGPYLWFVQVDYSGPNSPMAEAPGREWADEENWEEVAFDADGKAYRNSLGDRIVGVRRVFHDKIYLYERNEANDNYAKSNIWQDVVNAAEFMGWPIGTVLLKPITARQVVTGSIYHWRVRYVFKFRRDGWLRREANHGYRVWSGAMISGQKQKIASRVENPIDVLLDAAGYEIKDPTADAHWLYFKDYRVMNFLGLGIT